MTAVEAVTGPGSGRSSFLRSECSSDEILGRGRDSEPQPSPRSPRQYRLDPLDAGLTRPASATEWADTLLSSSFADVSSDSMNELSNENSSTLTQPASASPKRSPLTSSFPSSKSTNSDAPTTSAPTLQPRKPSPGLAARLKALGFGSKKSPPTTPTTTTTTTVIPSTTDRIGRLNQQQLRQLDESHQSNSKITVVERRGRPWKGVSLTALPKPASEAEVAQVGTTTGGKAYETSVDATVEPQPSPAFLPEIESSPSLDMDTNKYRLPDHTNGNGTKVQLETRREHLERTFQLPSPGDVPPPPLPKDTPPNTTGPTTTEFVPNLNSYFTPGHQRPGSIYTLSRASFANQLAQLTALQLPDAESLSSKVSAIPTAQAATRALINASEQIRSWISKASEVIGGLDSDDDVEWAAAGGREGLAEVEKAIIRFKELINVYVSAVEELHNRGDINQVARDDLNHAVQQMDFITTEWTTIERSLNTVKEQVEIAMEWEELWNNVLGDIQNEMDELSRLVFEMEERRHKSLMAAVNGDGGVDIGDLETIVEETPPQATRLQAQNNRFSLPAFPLSPSSPGGGNGGSGGGGGSGSGNGGGSSGAAMSLDDSSLLALFARMQPLRASLDFLPMRLSVFQTRAEQSFPTACEELEMRRSGLDGSYKKLESDAESLRKELGEDRWVIVFRGAGRQANKMYESVERSVVKLKEAVDAGLHLTNQPLMSKKIENYEAKKTHYGPAIERVLSIIDRGVKDRLTVNGEILRLHADIQSKWDTLKDQMRDVDATLDDLQSDRRGQQLRDSVSSMLSNDRSTIGSGHDTPGSSPPSSVIMASLGLDPSTPSGKLAKHRSASLSSHLPQPSNRRHSSMPTPAQGPKKASLSRLATLATPSSVTTPMAKIPRPSSTVGNRPRWNSSTNTSNVDTGHNFKPLTLTSPSPYARKTPATGRSSSSLTPTSSAGSKLPMLRSPIARSQSESPMPPDDTPTKPTTGSRLSFRERIGSPGPGPYAQQTLTKPRLANQTSMSALGNRRASLQPQRSSASSITEESRPSRPVSSMATSSRRVSMLPQPKGRRDSNVSGRESPQAIAGARVAMRQNSTDTKPKDNKPRWRG